MKKLISVSIVLALVLSLAPAMAASYEAVSGREPVPFRALSKLPTGGRAVHPSLTDDQLASVEGESSWSHGIVIEQMTTGRGTNIVVVQQEDGKSAVVERQIGGHSTKEAMRVLELSRVLLLGPLTNRVGTVVEQLLTLQERIQGSAPMHIQLP